MGFCGQSPKKGLKSLWVFFVITCRHRFRSACDWANFALHFFSANQRQPSHLRFWTWQIYDFGNQTFSDRAVQRLRELTNKLNRQKKLFKTDRKKILHDFSLERTTPFQGLSLYLGNEKICLETSCEISYTKNLWYTYVSS